MGAMKTLAIALEDGALDNPDLDESRRAGWNNALVGTYDPTRYVGEHKRAYRLGGLQLEEATLSYQQMRQQ